MRNLQAKESHVLWTILERYNRCENDDIANLDTSSRKTRDRSADDERGRVRCSGAESGANFEDEDVCQESVLWCAKGVDLADEKLATSACEEEGAAVPRQERCG